MEYDEIRYQFTVKVFLPFLAELSIWKLFQINESCLFVVQNKICRMRLIFQR